MECSDEKQFQWEILFERKKDHKVELELYSLPPWAGTWKFINFPFRQQKKDWDTIWPDYQPNISRIDEIQQLKNQVGINIIVIIFFWMVFAVTTLPFRNKLRLDILKQRYMSGH